MVPTVDSNQAKSDCYILDGYHSLNTAKYMKYFDEFCLYSDTRFFGKLYQLSNPFNTAHSQDAIVTVTCLSQLIGCIGFSAIVTIAPCETLHLILHDPFVAIKKIAVLYVAHVLFAMCLVL